jgi:hypothetical protein
VNPARTTRLATYPKATSSAVARPPAARRPAVKAGTSVRRWAAFRETLARIGGDPGDPSAPPP